MVDSIQELGHSNPNFIIGFVGRKVNVYVHLLAKYTCDISNSIV